MVFPLLPRRRLRARLRVPGDKSLSHRLALFAALAEGETHLAGFSSAADCASTLACLAALGVEIRRSGDDVWIAGRGPEGLRAPTAALDCGNSGSTLRMLAGLLAGRPFEATLDGDESLRRRPMERVAAPLRHMGARIETHAGCPPVQVAGGRLRAVGWTLDVPSAQVKSAVLLAGLQAAGCTEVSEPLPSRDHSERLLPLFGARLERHGLRVAVHGPARLHGVHYAIPGDPSSAAFLVVAALLLPDSELRLEGVLLNPQRSAFIEVLREMGGAVEAVVERHEPEPVGWIAARTSRLHGVRVAPERVPALVDEVPALAVAACAAQGTFELCGAAELRVKESDRLAALAEGLSRLGADIEERPDGLLIRGGRALRGAELRSHGDHRIAMALSVAAACADSPSQLDDARCAAVSFPGFFDLLREATA